MADIIISVDTALQQTLNDQDTLTVNAGISISSKSNPSVQVVGAAVGVTITNNGTIENIDAGERAIRFTNAIGATLNATIDNVNGTIKSDDDAMQIQGGAVTAGQIEITNGTLIQSGSGQAIDFAGAGGTFVTKITNSGTISSGTNDAIRPGGVVNILNYGIINGGTDAANSGSVDGIQFDDAADNGTVTNYNDAGGLISGDRHGINAAPGTTITVNNGSDSTNGGTITGRNGSGVGSDGTATITNYGTITGGFTAGVDTNKAGETTGVGFPDPNPDGTDDGDGDGIDVDFQLTLNNYGTVSGTGAGGHGSDGKANTSEGVAAGGGTINNYKGAQITGVGLGILIDDSSTGPAPFVTNINNAGTISGGTSFGIRIISTLNDTIINSGTISGGAGTAIEFGSGANTLDIRNGSAITGTTDAGTGTDLLTYAAYTAGGVTVNLVTNTATGTGGVTGFENVTGSAQGDHLLGGIGANTLNGGGGNDRLAGGDGNDKMNGGTGDDIYYYSAGDLIGEALNAGTDTVVTGGTYTLGSNIENGQLNGTADANLTGNTLNNQLAGNSGSNFLLGQAGDDVLVGAGGNDYLQGGLGRDELNGGTGGDRYDFNDVSESAVGALRDFIRGFSVADGDKIDLISIDANTTIGGNQAFTFINTAAFSGAAGELRFAAGIVSGDVDGGGVADFEIQLIGVTTATDAFFLL